jgi:hypothetical protein
MTEPAASDYDAHAGQYAAAVAQREQGGATVRDFGGFAATLISALRPGGRLVHVLNNPYTAICNGHGTDYFDSGAPTPYRGLWTKGIKTYYYQRTLEDYLDAFLTAGLRLTKLADLPAYADEHPLHTCLHPVPTSSGSCAPACPSATL